MTEIAAGTPKGESAPASTTPPGDAPAEGQSAKAAEPSPSTPAPEPDPPELEGYTDEELKAAYRALPDAVRKANNKIFTERMQKLGDDAKIADLLRRDPEGFLTELGKRLGREIAPAASTTAAAPATPAATAKKIAEQMLPFFNGDANSATMFEGILRNLISEETAAIRETQAQAVHQALIAEGQAELATFKKAHPDALQHEKAMFDFLQRFPATDDVPAQERLEAAYLWATRNQRAVATAQAEVDRLAAAAAATAGNATAAAGAAPIAPAAPSKFPTAAEAAAAAMQGIKWQ